MGDRRWRLGLAAYQPGELRWYPVFGFRLRPGETFARHALTVVSRRRADPVEETSIGSGAVVVECDTGQAAARIELALSEDALTGFLAWLEAAPPGPVAEFRCAGLALGRTPAGAGLSAGRPAPTAGRRRARWPAGRG